METSLRSGARTLSRGLRTADAGVAALGAAILALAYLRTTGGDRRLVHSAKVKPGQSIRVVVTHPRSQHVHR